MVNSLGPFLSCSVKLAVLSSAKAGLSLAWYPCEGAGEPRLLTALTVLCSVEVVEEDEIGQDGIDVVWVGQ